MIEVEDYTVEQARRSTLVVAGVFGLIAGWQFYRDRPTATIAFALAAGLLLVVAAIPAAARFFNKWWMTLAGVLGYVNSRIILSALFFLIITPIGWGLRLVGSDPLTRRKSKEPSYWRRREHPRQSREGFERSY